MSDETAVSSTGFARLRTIARLILGVASAIFVAVACYKLSRRWESGKVQVSWPWLIVSALPMALGTVVLAVGWKWLMERMAGKRVPLRPCLTLHFESQMARYTPGKVGMPLVRMAGAGQLGVPAAIAGYSVLTESISQVAVGGLVGFALLLAITGSSGGLTQAFGVLGVLGLAAFVAVTLVLVFVDRRHLPAAVVKLMKVEGTGPLVPRRAPLAHAVFWLLWSLHGYFAARAVGIPAVHAFGGAGLYTLSAIAGILALATPSGIGVREAVLSMGLAPLVGPAPAVATAIVSRAVSLVVDCSVWAVGRLLLR
ncbi:MAG TPA: lysylphosphatidylglycerol synthase transmembrane domain-containing protein [Polyangiaceae bacterium]|nr:lysylphosphatidylglycerol synthase transmembrane domain-containing protein [Polyangiaceae bacterium]